MSEPDSLSIARTSSGWRLVPLLLVMIGTAHFNRISISVAGAEVIIPKEGIDAKQMGWVYMAYLLVYTLGMSPGGLFIDRFGPRLALFVVGAGSAVFMALTGLSGLLWTGTSLWLGLLVVRGAMGSVNVATHPGAARLVGEWMAPTRHNLVNGMVNSSGCVGIALTYYVFGKLIDHFQWTGASFIAAAFTGVLALCWAIFTRIGRSTPRADAATPVSIADRGLPGEGEAPAEPGAQARREPPPREGEAPAEPGAQARREPPPREGETPAEPGEQARREPRPPENAPRVRAGALLANRSLVMLTLSYAAVGYFQYLFFYWAQYYFEQIREVGKDDSRAYTSILTFAMGLGMVAGGWFADHTRARFAHRRSVALVPVVGLTIAALALLPGLFTANPLLTMLCFAVAMAAAGTSEGAFWTLAVEIGGARGGLAAGILNTGGNAGGLLAPVLTPYLSAWLGWQAGLGVASVSCVLAALCWIWIDPHQRLEETSLGGQPEPVGTSADSEAIRKPRWPFG